jgi:hypothetical protein
MRECGGGGEWWKVRVFGLGLKGDAEGSMREKQHHVRGLGFGCEGLGHQEGGEECREVEGGAGKLGGGGGD